MAEFDREGRDAFLKRHGFREARSYFLVEGDRRYDSKAIAGVAHGYQHGEPLRASDFSGGEQTVQRVFGELGFDVQVIEEPDTEEPPKTGRTFGEIPGFPEGSTFKSRADLSKAGVHRPR